MVGVKKIQTEEIIRATGGQHLSGTGGAMASSVSTDTRTLAHDAAFFALSGEHFDAHNFLDQAAPTASMLIVSKPECVPSDFNGDVIAVPDTLTAYQDLAAWYCGRIGPKVIAVTGSVGKTSLKDMIVAGCAPYRKTAGSLGNHNNHIGVPETILSMDTGTEILVLEMGMNHAGEIHRLAEIGRPDIAAISNIGIAHQEHFDKADGIFRAKMEIVDFFKPEGCLIINGDDPNLAALKEMDGYTGRLFSAGSDRHCDYRVVDFRLNPKGESAFSIHHGALSQDFRLPFCGIYYGVTTAIAVAVLAEIGIDMAQAAEALKHMARTPHRLEMIRRPEYTLIDDSYNASPDSMIAALESLAAVSGKRRIAVLAGMNELGKDSENLHRATGLAVAHANIDLLVAVGDKAMAIADGALAQMDANRVVRCASNGAAIEFLRSQIKSGDTILVKGSRTMRTEEIIWALTDDNISAASGVGECSAPGAAERFASGVGECPAPKDENHSAPGSGQCGGKGRS